MIQLYIEKAGFFYIYRMKFYRRKVYNGKISVICII